MRPDNVSGIDVIETEGNTRQREDKRNEKHAGGICYAE